MVHFIFQPSPFIGVETMAKAQKPNKTPLSLPSMTIVEAWTKVFLDKGTRDDVVSLVLKMTKQEDSEDNHRRAYNAITQRTKALEKNGVKFSDMPLTTRRGNRIDQDALQKMKEKVKEAVEKAKEK
jgi:uncharacterized membrane protein YdfJ with MMPL/SSD domain